MESQLVFVLSDQYITQGILLIPFQSDTSDNPGCPPNISFSRIKKGAQ